MPRISALRSRLSSTASSRSRSAVCHSAAHCGERRLGDQPLRQGELRRIALRGGAGPHQPRQQVEEQAVEGLEALLLRGRAELVGERMRGGPIDVGQACEDRLDARRRARSRRCRRAAGLAARCPRRGARAAAIAAPVAAPSRRPPAPPRRRARRCSPASGCRSSRRQRERMVGSSWLGSDEISRNSARRGGSSSDFSSALAALMLSSSALSTITTRQAPSPPVCPRNDRGAAPRRSGCWRQSAWRARHRAGAAPGAPDATAPAPAAPPSSPRRPRGSVPAGSRSSGRASTCRASR